MKIMKLMTMIMIGAVSVSVFAQREAKPEKEVYTNRHHSIDMPVRGHDAKGCVINGEVFATNDHTDLQKICTASGGQVITPGKARRIAQKANRVTAICCQSSTNKRSFVMVRGEVKADSCGDAGTRINKAQCFKKNAEVYNHFKVDGLNPYSPMPRNKAGANLNEYVSTYEEKFSCGMDVPKKWTGRASRNTGNLIGNTFRKFTDLFRSKKNHKGQGKAADLRTLETDKVNDYNQALPVCCLSGSEYKVVANECACYASAVDSTKSTPKVVGVSENSCAGLHETYNNLEELKIHDSHNFLDEQLEEFMGERKCSVALKGKLGSGATCQHGSDSTEFILYELNCSKRERRKRNTMYTTTILCHKEIENAGEDSPVKVNYQDIKSKSEGSADGCHIAEKF